MRLLLLEDNVDAAESLAEALMTLDERYEIRWATRLKDAEEIARTEDLDFALVDLTLPDAEGCESVVALHAITPELPLVALTGSDFDTVALELIRCGVQDFLQKGNTSVQRIHQVLQLAAERRRQEATWRQHACYDWLTGALTRYELERQLAKAISHAARGVYLGAVMVIDVDDFKSVNDTHGHNAGDAVLTEIARRLTAGARAGDSLGRLGGDEFALIVEGLKSGEDAAAIAQKALDAISFDLTHGDGVVPVSGSIGVALFPDQGSDVKALLELADQAMYEAKRSGKNAFRFDSSANTENPGVGEIVAVAAPGEPTLSGQHARTLATRDLSRRSR